jgi:CheY-like chemotaxis protein
MDGKSILVVDDEASIRDLVVTALEACGHRVFAAWGGDKAMQILSQEPSIAGAIIDVVMPGMSGIDLADRIAKQYPRIKKIFITGFTEANLEGLRVFTKPFDITRLVEAIQNEIGYSPGAQSNSLNLLKEAHVSNVEDFLSKVETIERMVSAIPYMQQQLRSVGESVRIQAAEQQVRLDALREVGEGMKAMANLMSENMKQFASMLQRQRDDNLQALARRDEMLQDVTKKHTDAVIEKYSDLAMLFVGRKFIDYIIPNIFGAIILGIVWFSVHGFSSLTGATK